MRSVIWIHIRRLYEKTYLSDLLSKDEQRFVAASVTGMRIRLRAFIAWQEESNGTWQLFGRESDLGPDTGATAAAAVSMLRTYPIDRRSSNRHVPIVESLLNAQLSLDEEANVLRFLVLTGRSVEDRVASFRTRLLSEDAPVETQTEALKRLAVAYTIARAWRQAALPGRDEVAGHLVPRILSWRQAGAEFGGQLPVRSPPVRSSTWVAPHHRYEKLVRILFLFLPSLNHGDPKLFRSLKSDRPP